VGRYSLTWEEKNGRRGGKERQRGVAFERVYMCGFTWYSTYLVRWRWMQAE